MDRIDRMNAALAGDDLDRPPFSFWYHFGLQHAPTEAVVQAHLSLADVYQLDFLKVMSDYPFPLPPGLTTISTLKDWEQLETLRGTEDGWGQQLRVLEGVVLGLQKKTWAIETVFSPWTVACRLGGHRLVMETMRTNPSLMHHVLSVISTSIVNYVAAAMDTGIKGIYFSLSGASSQVMSTSEYSVWGAKYDLPILNAVRDSFNVVHMHGNEIHFELADTYPAAAVSWSLHPGNPTLLDARGFTEKTFLGGINELTLGALNIQEILSQVTTVISSIGTKRLIVTPGCLIPADTPPRLLHAIRRHLETFDEWATL